MLAGDVGGTNTRLACYDTDGRRWSAVAEQVVPSRDHPGLDAIVTAFKSSRRLRFDRACIGIAGPIRDGRCEATNLPWVVDAKRLASELRLPHVRLINDLEANAYGTGALEPADFEILNIGKAGATGNMAVISAGTGLGEAGLFWDGTLHRPFACEGGHSDFAPANELQVGLWTFLSKGQGHVSWERVLSGPGLHNIYRYLRDAGRGDEPSWLKEDLAKGDPSVAISKAALAARSDLCVRALDLFVELYGAEAGNLALKVMAVGGVCVGGGIAPKIIEKMKSSAFMAAFTAKGRMRTLLQDMPVRVILNDRAALLGAARCAWLGV
ncbi:MAG: glucokinase [Nitrospirae bacterium]|nr:glucokinase [Nitrospirota bacterium]